MGQRFVQSTSYARLLQASAEFLATIDGRQEVLIVAHTRGAADDFVRAACSKGFLGLHCTTLTGLAVALAEAPMARAGLSALSALGAEALVARIIYHLKNSEIPYFEPVAETPGLPRAVARTLAELRVEGVLPEQIAETGRPGADLSRIAESYERELVAQELADFPMLMQHAIAVAREGKHRLLRLPVLVLDVDADSAARRQLFDAVLSHAPTAFVASLKSDRQRTGEAEDLDAPAKGTLERIRESLFGEAAANAEADDSLAYFSAAGESLECVEIARRIRKLAQGGVPFDRMAILLRSAERYQPMVEEALRRADVPAYFSRGVSRPDPAGRALLALLACAMEGCSATRFAEYLSLGQVPPLDRNGETQWAFPPSEDEVLREVYATDGAASTAKPLTQEDDESPIIEGTLQAPRAWEKLLVDAAVIGGRDRWSRRLRGLEAEFRVRLENLESDDEATRAHMEREIERLRNLEKFALPLIDQLAALNQKASWGEWIERLTRLAGAALRRPERVVAALAELQAMAEVGPVGLDEVSGVLSDRLRFLRVEPPLRRYGQVFVGGIEEARGRAFDVVFLPGLCGGQFPSRPREDPILLDEHRRKLGGLRVQDDRVLAERRRLHIACAAASSRLVFSYPRMDVVESRPRVPSFYALEIVRAANGRLPDLRAFEETARQGAPSRLDWPAPAEAQEAIDDAEFDLAALGRTFALADPSEAKARGHYLINANEHLVRSLRAQAMQVRRRWTVADGIVEPDAATRAVLAQHRLHARAYSPSALQHYAACPYRFLLHGILRLRPREEAVALEQMDALTRGALFHEAQRRLFGELQAAGMLPLRRQDRPQILTMGERVLEEVAAQYAEKLAPAIDRVWRNEIDSLRIDLRGWIHYATIEDGWTPSHFEFSFGLPADRARDPQSTGEEAVLDNGMRLRGAIDLIERNGKTNTLRITDHKTGKAPQERPAYIAGGAIMQPLAYALAAEALLGTPVECSRLFYCTQRGGYEVYSIGVTPQARLFFKHALGLIDAEIDRGFLPVAPKKEACQQCDYVAVCGREAERRVRWKPGEALDGLQQLRNIL